MAFKETNPALPTRHNPYLHKVIIDELVRLPQGHVLDLPSGPGYLIKDLIERGFTGIPAEIDSSLHCFKDLDYRKVDMTQRFPFEDATFDYVVSIEGIEHIENQFSFLREIRRVLKTGGKLFLTTPNIHSLESRLNFFMSGFHTMAAKPTPLDTENIFFEHISPIALHQIYFAGRRSGLNIEKLLNHRHRKGSTLLYWVFFPFIYASVWSSCFKKEKDPARRAANHKLFDLLISRENQLGSHTIISATAV